MKLDLIKFFVVFYDATQILCNGLCGKKSFVQCLMKQLAFCAVVYEATSILCSGSKGDMNVV